MTDVVLTLQTVSTKLADIEEFVRVARFLGIPSDQPQVFRTRDDPPQRLQVVVDYRALERAFADASAYREAAIRSGLKIRDGRLVDEDLRPYSEDDS